MLSEMLYLLYLLLLDLHTHTTMHTKYALLSELKAQNKYNI